MRQARRHVLAALAAAALAAPARAQVPGAAPPGPLTGAQTGGKAIVAGPKIPDLVVTMGSGNPFPSSFTVKNQGAGDAGVSVLKVSATLLPFEGGADAACSGPFSSICNLRNQANAAYFTAERLRATCGDPFADVLEAVPALRPGETKTFSRDMSPFGHLTLRLGVHVGTQPGTHIKQGVTTLVCAFDVLARADTSNQVSELREDNNTATLRVYREIRLE